MPEPNGIPVGPIIRIVRLSPNNEYNKTRKRTYNYNPHTPSAPPPYTLPPDTHPTPPYTFPPNPPTPPTHPPTPQFIDVFDVSRGYSRVCRCAGHSSTVRHLDWAADSGAIQSVDQAYEVGGVNFEPIP